MTVQGFRVEHEALRSAAGALPNQVAALGRIRGTVAVRAPGAAFANVTGSPAASAGHGANIDAMVQQLVAEAGRLAGIIGGIGTTTADFRTFDDEQARRQQGQNPDVVLAQAGGDTPPPTAALVQRDGREYIRITPSNQDWPAFEIPNTVGVTEGFTMNPSLNPFDPSHTYSVESATSIPFADGRDLTSQALTENPTPGDDRPASPDGTKNDALFWGQGNVNSYVVPSSDPTRFTDTIVNYTHDDHLLSPGFVLRRGMLAEDGTVTLQTWGEGAGWMQHWATRTWRDVNWGVWEWNQGQIEDTVLERLNQPR